MAGTHAVVTEYDPNNGSYGATSPDFGIHVIGIGKSEAEAVERLHNALQGHLAFLRERGEPIPEPRSTVTTIAVAL